MDDIGFEEAVAGLTEDKTSLISGFAGGMPYYKPQIEGNFKESFLQYPEIHLQRIIQNQIKLYSMNLPEIFFGNSYKLSQRKDLRFI